MRREERSPRTAERRREFQNLDARPKKRRRRGRSPRLYIMIGAGALALVLVFLLLYFFTPLFGSRDTAKASPIPAGAQAASGADGLYYLKGTTLFHTDSAGGELWSSKFSTGALDLRVSDELICVFDASSASVIDPKQTPLFTVPPSEFTILDAACGSSSVAFLTQIGDDSTVQYLRVFDKEGTELYRYEVNDDKILKFGLTGTADTLWTLTLDTTGVSPISRITTMNPSQKKLTGNIDVSDQLISDVFFTKSEMFLSGTSNLSRYNGFSEKQSDTLVYGLVCIDAAQTQDSAVFAYIPETAADSSYNIRLVIASPGTTQTDVTLIQLPKGIFAYSCTPTSLYCFGANRVYVYDISGAFRESIDTEFTIEKVEKLSNTQCLLTGGGLTYLFSTK